MTSVAEHLAHYGVKGMKWGVNNSGDVTSTSAKMRRRSRPATDVTAKQKPGTYVRTTGGKKQIAANDAIKVAASRQLAKRSTTDALSTEQLKEAVTRMNLEQQYTNLVKKTDRRTRGQRFVQALIGDDPASAVTVIKSNGPAVANQIGRNLKR